MVGRSARAGACWLRAALAPRWRRAQRGIAFCVPGLAEWEMRFGPRMTVVRRGASCRSQHSAKRCQLPREWTTVVGIAALGLWEPSIVTPKQ